MAGHGAAGVDWTGSGSPAGDPVRRYAAGMSRDEGFWSDRPRAGQDDAQLLLTEHIHMLRQLPYAELRRRADGEPQVEEVAGLSGRRYRRCTRIDRRDRRDGGQVVILVQVDDGTPAGRLDPLAEELVLAGADGEMVGEYTMASEGNDPRRYAFPTWLPVVGGILGIASIVLFLALA